MKRLLFAPIILVTSLVASLALGLELGDLVERDDLSYEKFTNIPFTGEVTGLEQGAFKDGKREGLWVSYYRGGQLLWAGSFKDGKREGFFVRYWRDGTVDASWTGTWKNGEAEWDEAKLMVPNAGQILMSFPICRFGSSWGPRCPDSEAEINAVRLFSGLSFDPRIEKIGLNADRAFIETDVWYYSIHGVKENDLGFTFHFTDDSKCCTYLTAEIFYAERDKGSLGWVIVGSELTYISGPDQQNIGKYFGFDIPVPLRVDE